LDYVIFVILAPLTAIILIGVLFSIARSRAAPGSYFLLSLVGICIGWLVANTLEVIVPDAQNTLFWARVTYIFICFAPMAWLAFALSYTNQQSWLKPIYTIPAAIIPLITILLVWTNDLHGLVWRSYRFVSVGTLMGLQVATYGLWFWVQASYNYILMASGAMLILFQVSRTYKVYRRQVIGMVAGVLVVLVINFIHIFHLIPELHKDYSPLGLSIAGLLFVISTSRYHLLDLVPVARDQVVERMRDGTLILDARNRLVDCNPAAQHIFGWLEPPIGQSADQICQIFPDLHDLCQKAVITTAETQHQLDGKTVFYEVQTTPLEDTHGHSTGRMVTFHDVTDRKLIESALKASETSYRTLVDNQAEGIGIVDLQERFIFANPAAEQIMGVAPGKLVGRSLEEFVSPAQFLKIREQTKLRQLGEKSTYEVEITHPDSTKHVMEITAAPQFSADGVFMGSFGIFRDSTERRQAEQALQARQRYLSLLSDMTSAALEASDMQAMLQALSDRMGALLNADGCYLTLWDEDKQITIPMAASGPLRDTYPSDQSYPGELTMTRSVLMAGHALVAEDVYNSPYISRSVSENYPTRSMLGLPLIAGGRKLGAALVCFNQPHVFTPEEEAWGEQASAQIALAVARERLFEELRQAHGELVEYADNLVKRTVQLYTAAEISRSASSFLNLDQLLHKAVDLAGERFNLYYVGLFLVDESGRWAVLRAATGGVGQKLIEQGFRLEVGGQSMVGWCIANQQARIAQDAGQDAVRLANPLLSETRSEMVLPLTSRDQIIGALTIQSGRINAFDEDEMAVFQTMADQLANAIVNVRLYEQLQQELAERQRIEEALQRRANEMTVLYETTHDLVIEQNLSELLHTIVERAAGLLNASGGGLYLCEAEQRQVRCVVSYNTLRDYTGVILKYGEGAAGMVAETGEPLIIDDYRTWERRAAIYEKDRPFISMLSVPLRWQDRVIGVIHVLESTKSRAFTQEDLRVLTLFADQAAVAIENSSLLGELQQANVLLEELATTDKLTGAYNRRKFDEVIVNEIKKAQRYHHPLVLLMFDIDHFKEVNDRHGHHAGDLALVELTDLVLENIRGSDWLVRWGGEEFFILAPGITLEQAVLLAEKVRQLVDEREFASVGHMTISLGVTPYLPGDTPESLVLRVDAVLYRAKREGRNRVEYEGTFEE
jgi:diguanylate cyclase (GGDEF)-like protein/PAS domain S-box-containing protein